MKEENYTEQYKGIIMLRKGRTQDTDIWFATIGNYPVSDRGFRTKEELIENLENVTLERVCKMITGAFGRAIELSTKMKNNENKNRKKHTGRQ